MLGASQQLSQRARILKEGDDNTAPSTYMAMSPSTVSHPCSENPSARKPGLFEMRDPAHLTVRYSRGGPLAGQNPNSLTWIRNWPDYCHSTLTSCPVPDSVMKALRSLESKQMFVVNGSGKGRKSRSFPSGAIEAMPPLNSEATWSRPERSTAIESQAVNPTGPARWRPGRKPSAGASFPGAKTSQDQIWPLSVSAT